MVPSSGDDSDRIRGLAADQVTGNKATGCKSCRARHELAGKPVADVRQMQQRPRTPTTSDFAKTEARLLGVVDQEGREIAPRIPAPSALQ